MQNVPKWIKMIHFTWFSSSCQPEALLLETLLDPFLLICLCLVADWSLVHRNEPFQLHNQTTKDYNLLFRCKVVSRDANWKVFSRENFMDPSLIPRSIFPVVISTCNSSKRIWRLASTSAMSAWSMLDSVDCCSAPQQAIREESKKTVLAQI